VDEIDWTNARAGDGEAFGRIFDRHRARVARHARALVPTFVDAEDVVAVAFLEAWRLRRRVRIVDGSVLPWLLVTATNVARNLSRSARRHARALDRLPAPDDEDDLGADSTAVDALRGLSLEDQRVITLCVLYDYTAAEAAETLGVPVGTVKSRLSRARGKLAARVIASSEGTFS
jgi:RNA polymerase sigma factor (sigma-70 family)